MGFVKSFTSKVLAVARCRCFAHDQCFKNARRMLEESGINWEDELLELNQSYSVFGTSVMDNVFFYQDRFEILVDARGFKPEEIKCTVTPRSVEVLAQTENQIENAQRRMTLTRQYVLPKNASPENGTCCLSNEGIFLVTAPWA
ncbi:alpha-crystallin B chain-like isoform X3 [Sitophilus oryzae]|uniref:Alpha-crystallin B chain-like isoform X3 n=1 Tax=Sitophilus oryzae TaxID=7048 RepID=A0A6J2XDY0_SITOR|nr:alpha-crystallin B chain-like isoform X3 [Sitophilus oryzae]